MLGDADRARAGRPTWERTQLKLQACSALRTVAWRAVWVGLGWAGKKLWSLRGGVCERVRVCGFPVLGIMKYWVGLRLIPDLLLMAGVLITIMLGQGLRVCTSRIVLLVGLPPCTKAVVRSGCTSWIDPWVWADTSNLAERNRDTRQPTPRWLWVPSTRGRCCSIRRLVGSELNPGEVLAGKMSTNSQRSGLSGGV